MKNKILSFYINYERVYTLGTKILLVFAFGNASCKDLDMFSFLISFGLGIYIKSNMFFKTVNIKCS